MTSVPPIDRTRPPFRDDPVIAALTDEQFYALTEVLGRFLLTAAQRCGCEQRAAPLPRTGRPSLETTGHWRPIAERAEQLRAAHPGAPYDRIAGLLGVAPSTLRRYRRLLERDHTRD